MVITTYLKKFLLMPKTNLRKFYVDGDYIFENVWDDFIGILPNVSYNGDDIFDKVSNDTQDIIEKVSHDCDDIFVICF